MLGRVFKAYDVRGTYPDLLTDTMAFQIGSGAARYLLQDAADAGDTTPMMQNLVVGRDMRKSSPKLSTELIKGIRAGGASVIDVGLVDTSFVYFAINHLDCAGGVMVTASHNPPQYNGFKTSKRKAKPVGESTGLADVRKYAAMSDTNKPPQDGTFVDKRDLWDAYTDHVRSFLDTRGRKIKVVVDASNGMAGTMVPKIFGENGSAIEGLEIVEMNFDNTKGVFVHEPNPLVASNVEDLCKAVVAEEADLGVCFDGDADRCVVVDEKGKIIGCDALTALLAQYFLSKEPGGSVVYDLRSTKAVAEEIEKAGGAAIRSRVGHVFMKQVMSDEGCVFGGELSGHFYFRDNFNADSGAIAMATVLSLMAEKKRKLSNMIRPIARYKQSGEINFENEEKDEALDLIREEYFDRGEIDELDGVTVDCFESEGWWCNIRKSNTEPLLRLNAEAKDQGTLNKVLSEIAPKLGTRVDH